MAGRRMGGKYNPALERVVLDNIPDEQIVATFAGFVADQDTVGVAADKVVGQDMLGFYLS